MAMSVKRRYLCFVLIMSVKQNSRLKAISVINADINKVIFFLFYTTMNDFKVSS